jgi:hypothetical protein
MGRKRRLNHTWNVGGIMTGDIDPVFNALLRLWGRGDGLAPST